MALIEASSSCVAHRTHHLPRFNSYAHVVKPRMHRRAWTDTNGIDHFATRRWHSWLDSTGVLQHERTTPRMLRGLAPIASK